MPEIGEILLRAEKLENEQHSSIAQGIGFDGFQIQEFGHTLVVGPEQLGINLGLDRGALNLGEAMAAEEFSFKGQTEDALDANFPSPGDDALDDGMANPLPAIIGFYGNGTDLGQVLPQNVEGAAANNFLAIYCNGKFLDILIQSYGLFRE
jgi:hypothetical protein